MTLLVVDDNDERARHARHLLRACGAHVLQARNAATALAYVDAEESVDAIVTDLSMPTLDGVELVRRLRQRRPMRSIPVIAVTGFYEACINTRGVVFDAFLRKPVDLDELCRTIRSIVDRRPP